MKKEKRDKMREERLSICSTCPDLYKDPIMKTRWCGLCGCNLYIKAGMRDKHCAAKPAKW